MLLNLSLRQACARMRMRMRMHLQLLQKPVYEPRGLAAAPSCIIVPAEEGQLS